MSVAKSELICTWRFFKLRLRDARIGIGAILALMVFVCVGTCGMICVSFSSSTAPISQHFLADFPMLLIAVMPLVLAIMISRYENSNKRYSVYPLTDTSRFLSAQALYYFLIALAIAAAVFFYLVQYLFFTLVSVWKPGVVIAYGFSAHYLITGSLVLFTWLALLAAVLSLLVTLVRAFKLVAIVPLVVLFAMLLTLGLQARLGSLQKVLIKLVTLLLPKSAGTFLLRGLLIWLILFGVTFALNKLMRHLKIPEPISWAPLLVTVPIIVVAALFTAEFSLFAVGGGFNGSANDYIPANAQTITLDASQVPKGSTIEVRQRALRAGASKFSKSWNYSYLSGLSWDNQGFTSPDAPPETGSIFKGKNIYVTSQLPSYFSNNQRLMEYARPALTAQLKGTVLYVDYHYTHKVDVIEPTIWIVLEGYTKYDYNNIGKKLGTKSAPFSNGYLDVSAAKQIYFSKR